MEQEIQELLRKGAIRQKSHSQNQSASKFSSGRKKTGRTGKQLETTKLVPPILSFIIVIYLLIL